MTRQRTNDGRDTRGRFAAGNPGGPGRPRRAVEADYLMALADSVSRDDWREIVRRAVEDAKAGNHQARVWLAGFLIGESASLFGMAVKEFMGESIEIQIVREAATRRSNNETFDCLLTVGAREELYRDYERLEQRCRELGRELNQWDGDDEDSE